MQNLLLIFVKNPIKGEVKTRLAADIGEEKAVEIYQQLLDITKRKTLDIQEDIWIMYGNKMPEMDIWANEKYVRKGQNGKDLGEKMQNAFAEGFAHQYEKIVIIGSDCPEITQEIIENAFKALNDSEIVFGPAKDGGYYLLGMKELHSFLFQNKKWSTETVLQDSLVEIIYQNIDYQLLVALNDVDRVGDLKYLEK